MAAWSRRARLNRLVDQVRRESVAAVPTPVPTCDHCGEDCGTETIHQARQTFRSESCYRAFVTSLEAA